MPQTETEKLLSNTNFRVKYEFGDSMESSPPTKEDEDKMAKEFRSLWTEYREIKDAIATDKPLTRPSPKVTYGIAPKLQEFYKQSRSKEGLEPEDADSKMRGFLEKELEKIERLPSGKKLLEDINKSLNDSKENFNIMFTEKEDDRLYLKNNTIKLNLWKNIFSTSEGEIYRKAPIMKARSVIPIEKGEGEVVEIGAGLSPFYITLAHEMTHLKHKMEAKSKEEFPGGKDDPDKIFDRNASIWQKTEEKRAIFDPIDVSELTLRKEAGEPLRYGHHGPSASFYEPISEIMKNIPPVVNHSIIGGIEELVRRLPQSGPFAQELEEDSSFKKGLPYTKTDMLAPVVKSLFPKTDDGIKIYDYMPKDIVAFATDRAKKENKLEMLRISKEKTDAKLKSSEEADYFRKRFEEKIKVKEAKIKEDEEDTFAKESLQKTQNKAKLTTDVLKARLRTKLETKSKKYDDLNSELRDKPINPTIRWIVDVQRKP